MNSTISSTTSSGINTKGLSHNLALVDSFEPNLLWRHFAHLAAIPRPSGLEKAVLDYIQGIALKAGCKVSQDGARNLLVTKPGNQKGLSPLGFQGHVDMVCEKNAGNPHQFDRDPICFHIREGRPGWLFASQTTLGADNGIGVAAMLALMEDSTRYRRDMEFLFTVDEETGLSGAQGLKTEWLRSKTLLNLDTEEEGALYVGCSGGLDLDARWKLPRQTKKDQSAARTQDGNAAEGHFVYLAIKNLRGGHSGIDIDKQRANALKLLIHTVADLLDRDGDAGCLGVVALGGGKARNAVPREASALLRLNPGSAGDNFLSTLPLVLKEREAFWQGIYREEDACLRIEMRSFKASQADEVEDVLFEDLGDKAKLVKLEPFETLALKKWLWALKALPSQPFRFELAIPGLVRTSSNLGVLGTEVDGLNIKTKLRGSYDPELALLREEIRSLIQLADGEVLEGGGYCGWQPDLKSHLLQMAQKSHKELFGKQAHVKAIHAGLECGLIGMKYPQMQMISFGPNIENAHSPDEAVEVASVGRFWIYLKHLVASLDQEA